MDVFNFVIKIVLALFVVASVIAVLSFVTGDQGPGGQIGSSGNKAGEGIRCVTGNPGSAGECLSGDFFLGVNTSEGG